MCSTPENDASRIICTVLLNNMMALDELLPIEQELLMEEEGGFANCPTQKESVKFGGGSVVYVESLEEMAEEDKHDIWYTKCELGDFKQRARQLCKQQQMGCFNTSEESTRGMDVYFPSRQRAHAKYVSHILQAYYIQCAGNPEYVARLAEKWSLKSTQRALHMGIQDSYEAYFPSIEQKTELLSASRNVTPSRWEPERRL